MPTRLSTTVRLRLPLKRFLPGLKHCLERQNDAAQEKAVARRRGQSPAGQPGPCPATPPQKPSDATPNKMITWMMRP